MHFSLPFPVGVFVFLKETFVDVVARGEVLGFDIFVAANDKLGSEGVHG